MSKIAASENHFFLAIVTVAEETAGLSLALSETPKTGFVASLPNYTSCTCVCLLLYCSSNENGSYFILFYYGIRATTLFIINWASVEQMLISIRCIYESLSKFVKILVCLISYENR